MGGTEQAPGEDQAGPRPDHFEPSVVRKDSGPVREPQRQRSTSRRGNQHRDALSRNTLRKWVIVSGVIILASGLAYSLAPIPFAPSLGPTPVAANETLVIHVDFTFEEGAKPILSIEWSSTRALRLSVEACGRDSGCSHPNLGIVGYGSTSNGSLTLSVVNGDYYGVIASAASEISYSVSTSFPFFFLGLPVAVGGMVLFLAGTLFLGRRRSSLEEDSSAVGSGQEISLSALLEDLATNELTVVYRCPSCDNPIRISRDTLLSSLSRCGVCHAELDQARVTSSLESALGGLAKSP